MFKCPNSYCLPYQRVCDGTTDCLNFEDEKLCQEYICDGMLHCKGQTYCVHILDTCDGNPNCPLRDDELNCDHGMCPRNCTCQNYALWCTYSNIDWILSANVTYIKALVFKRLHKDVHLSITGILTSLLQILYLDMSDSNLKSICQTAGTILRKSNTSTVIHMDLGKNILTALLPKCFSVANKSRILLLRNNNINLLYNNTFYGLVALFHLDISYNSLTSLSGKFFTPLSSLKKLNLKKNQITTFSNMFTNTKMALLLTDNPIVCCYTDQKVTNCSAKPTYLSSCKDLLSSKPMKFLIWIIGVFSFIMNATNVVVRLSPYYQRSPVDYNIISIAISDALLGLYLILLGSADIYFIGKFAGYQSSWRKSWVCNVAATLYLFSSLSSITNLVALSIIRYVLIRFPFYYKITLSRKIRKWVISKFVCLVFGTTALVQIYFVFYGFSPNFICLLVSFGETNIFLMVTTIIISSLQVIAPIIIVINFHNMSQMMKKSEFGKYPRQLPPQIIIVIFSNVLCWVPSSIIFLIPLSGYKMSAPVMAWNVILVIPINSAINSMAFLSDLMLSRHARKADVHSTKSRSSSGTDY